VSNSEDMRIGMIKNMSIMKKEIERLRSIADDLFLYIINDADTSLREIKEQMDWWDFADLPLGDEE